MFFIIIRNRPIKRIRHPAGSCQDAGIKIRKGTRTMKRKLSLWIAAMLLLLCVQPAYAAGMRAQSVDTREKAEPSAKSVTISFQANGGVGVMEDLVVEEGASALLTPNAFAREGFSFTGWNTKANGTGDVYADQADAAPLLASLGKKRSVVLYAQWSMFAPSIRKLKATKPGSLKITFDGVSQASRYEIEYATNPNFKNAGKAEAKGGTSSLELTDLMPGKVSYVRMRGYDETTESFGAWSAVQKKKTKKGSTIVNVKSETAIEADITLTGSGTGYHAKLVLCTPTSAVSFGIQFDQYAAAPYTGKAMALIENVASNNPGGQKYDRPGNRSLTRGKTYHMLLAVDKKGRGSVYLDYKKIGSFSNSMLAKQDLALRVDGCARLNGDNVKAVFKNIKCKKGKKYDPNRQWNRHEFKMNKTLKHKVGKDGAITISGRISGLPGGGDWDSCYEDVSDIIQFY